MKKHKVHKIAIINGRKFYFRKRGEYWYYRTFDDSGKEISRSTGQTSKGAAINWLNEQVQKGNIVAGNNLTFGKYASNWWIWDKCNYIKAKLLRGSRISRNYADAQRSYLEHHILPYFGNIKLTKIKTKDIETWLLNLKNNTSLSPTTINHCLRVLKIMLKEAKRLGYISVDPSKGVSQLGENPKKRGILYIKEVRALFDKKDINRIWNDDLRHYTLNMLAASTGLRMGEAQALQRQDVFENYIVINKTWRRKHGLYNEAKWGSNRKVPIPSKTSKYLKKLLSQSPYKEPEDLVFYSKDRHTPIDNKTILVKFYSALEKIGIAEEKRKKRGITFHSWRHFFNTYVRSRGIPDSKIQGVTGHKTIQMTNHYTDFALEDYKDINLLQEELFK